MLGNKSHQLGSVDQSKNYKGYTWQMCATFGARFRCQLHQFSKFPVNKISKLEKFLRFGLYEYNS